MCLGSWFKEAQSSQWKGRVAEARGCLFPSQQPRNQNGMLVLSSHLLLAPGFLQAERPARRVSLVNSASRRHSLQEAV